MTKPVNLIVSALASVSVLMLCTSACMEDRTVDISYGNSLQDQGGGSIGAGIEGCLPPGEPTWEEPIDDIMQDNCTMCHQESADYSQIQVWVESGELEEYCAMGSGHYLPDPNDKDACLRWVEIDTPEASCSE